MGWCEHSDLSSGTPSNEVEGQFAPLNYALRLAFVSRYACRDHQPWF